MSPDDKPLAYDAYQSLASRYAARIDDKPHNAYYERPAMLALLPDLNGLRVFDAGCGTGLYAEYFLEQGADVSGVDVSPNMLAFARERTGGRADLRVHDLAHPLDFEPDAGFDLVFSALVLHYLADWDAPLSEFHRILRPGGLLVFSTGHPLDEFKFSESRRYFDVEQVGMPWRGFGGEPVYVAFYRRPLSAVTESLWRAGFVIERLIEPLPTEEYKRADPEGYQELLREPVFMCVRARKITRDGR